MARALGSFDKEYSEESGLVTFCRDFGGLKLRFVFTRQSVCTCRVVGTVEVPEVVIPAHTKELVEWDCQPILAEDVQSQSAEGHTLGPEEARQIIIDAGDF